MRIVAFAGALLLVVACKKPIAEPREPERSENPPMHNVAPRDPEGPVPEAQTPRPVRGRAVLAGDQRLNERLRSPDLLPLGSRIRRRLQVEAASRDELCACLDHVLDAAGNPALMTIELRVTLAEHALGNYRIMMNMADERLRRESIR
ncbi:MAG TPA: hypothetical protein VFV99_11540 [Kofleriaceae bacterium]|nr:hypothetical protein [Kofleriaceae bacterium]